MQSRHNVWTFSAWFFLDSCSLFRHISNQWKDLESVKGGKKATERCVNVWTIQHPQAVPGLHTVSTANCPHPWPSIMEASGMHQTLRQVDKLRRCLVDLTSIDLFWLSCCNWWQWTTNEIKEAAKIAAHTHKVVTLTLLPCRSALFWLPCLSASVLNLCFPHYWC